VKKTVTPVDVYAINDVGVDEWQAEYSWPVSDSDFIRFVDKVVSAYGLLCSRADADVRDIFLVDHSFVTYLIQVCHASVVKNKVTDVRALSEDYSVKYYYPDWQSFAKAYSLENQKIGVLQSLKFRVKLLGKNIIYNKNLTFINRLFNLLGRQEVWSIGTDSEQKSEYIYSQRRFCSYKYAHDIVKWQNIKERQGYEAVSFDSAIEDFLSTIRKDCGEFTGNLDFNVLAQSWKQRLNDLLFYYKSLIRMKRVPEVLHVSDVANPLHKLIALAFMKRGVVVNGYNHGNNMMLVQHKLISYTEISHCTNYVCSTKKSASYFQKAYEGSDISAIRKVNFVSSETMSYKKLKDSFPSIMQGNINKIMIVGYPLSAMRLPFGAGLFFHFKLDLEIRLAKYLRSKGFNVTYKIHPDTDQQVINMVTKYFDVIDSGSFEDAVLKIDSILFTYTETTTFSYGLCTNKHVVLADVEVDNWNSESIEWVKERCYFVEAYFNDDNRVLFNKDNLLNAYNGNTKSYSCKYIDEVMIPAST